MSLIKHAIDIQAESIDDAFVPGTDDALKAAGLKPTIDIPPAPPEPKDIFRDAGAGVDDAARTIASVMMHGDSDQSRLKAADLALKVQEVFKDMDNRGTKVPTVIVNIQGNGESSQLVNLLVPNVST